MPLEEGLLLVALLAIWAVREAGVEGHRVPSVLILFNLKNAISGGSPAAT